jgi:hypothetical protein
LVLEETDSSSPLALLQRAEIAAQILDLHDHLGRAL